MKTNGFMAFTLSIKTLSGDLFFIEYDSLSNILELKQSIFHARPEYPVERQLLFKDEEKADIHSLQDGDTLFLVIHDPIPHKIIYYGIHPIYEYELARFTLSDHLYSGILCFSKKKGFSFEYIKWFHSFEEACTYDIKIFPVIEGKKYPTYLQKETISELLMLWDKRSEYPVKDDSISFTIFREFEVFSNWINEYDFTTTL